MSSTPFEINIEKDEVERLKRKLEDTRLPQVPIVPDAGGDYAHLNRHEHFITEIEDESYILKIHYTYKKSSKANAIPLILVHGWPGSFHEFDRVIDEFAEGGDQVFDIVVPSLPGFCWSSPPPRRKWTMRDTARAFNKLMIQLGYTAYVVQAGDWGSFVAREMGAQFKECKAVHLNFCPVELGEELTDLTPRELKIKDRQRDWLDNHLGYAVLMRTRPQTIGVALTDNPVGILAWVGEKYTEAVHPSKLDPPDPGWDQAILTTCSLYYFTDCIMTASLPYFEGTKHADFGSYFLKKENYIRVPMGYTTFFLDTRPGTERTVKATGDLVFYNECDEGGHFAALERPDIILHDCRKFFGEWYKA